MALSSTLTHTLILLLMILSLQLFTTPSSAASGSDFSGSAFLTVSPTSFIDSASNAITLLQNVSSSFLSRVTTRSFDDFRVSNAVSDCVELLDMASDHLAWSVSATQSSNEGKKYNGTGNLSSDLGTWISAVLTHAETCIDGFEGTYGNVKDLVVSGGLREVVSLVKGLLSQVVPVSVLSGITNNGGEFPSWIKAEDEELLLQAALPNADAVVAADGTGNYKKIMDAVAAAPEFTMKRFVIHVKKGFYEECVEINKKKWNIMMVGDGMDVTHISGHRNRVDNNLTTYKTATFAVNAVGFIARDISFINTAGPTKEQAVALRSNSDLSVFFRCGIEGYQDSLYPHSHRQFYKECKITGTVDFICGNAAAVFQSCQIQARKGLNNQKNTIAAQSRTELNQTSGFSFQNCSITPNPDLVSSIGSIQTYLGRPWKNFSRTVFMQSYISEIISPEGWLEWESNKTYDDTLFFGEYQNSGPGAGVANRVKWRGYHVLNDSQASEFTVDQFIFGYLWLPPIGLNYIGGLKV